jgi:LysR family glycine cleavage system transcriptional activator
MSIANLPLNALRAFEAAGRHLSFSKAAEELSVTAAAVSHQVRGLEERLGHELFRRRHRALELTAAGHLLLPGLAEGLSTLEYSVSRLSMLDNESRLVITADPTLAAKWLLPNLQAFQDSYPDLDVHLSSSSNVIDLHQQKADIALRYGAGNYEGLHAEALSQDYMTPVCNPSLLEGEHPLTRPEDLAHHTLLHDESWGYLGAVPDWSMWLKAAGVEGVDVSRGPHFDVAVMALEAAAMGRGVALMPRALVIDDLARGRLVAPFDLTLQLDCRVYFVCIAQSLERPAVAAFRGWVKEMAARTYLPTEPVAQASEAVVS